MAHTSKYSVHVHPLNVILKEITKNVKTPNHAQDVFVSLFKTLLRKITELGIWA